MNERFDLSHYDSDKIAEHEHSARVMSLGTEACQNYKTEVGGFSLSAKRKYDAENLRVYAKFQRAFAQNPHIGDEDRTDALNKAREIDARAAQVEAVMV